MSRIKMDLRNCDCKDLMKEFPDKYFQLAIVDPPYGLDERLTSGGRYDHYNCCGGITYNVHSPARCKHLTDKGCAVESLGCKLSFCGEIPEFPRELRNKIDCLAHEFKDFTGSKVGVWDIIRKSREETIEYLINMGVINEEE